MSSQDNIVDSQHRTKLIKSLKTLLKKFDRYELQTYIVPCFEQFSWGDIKQALVMKKLAMTVVNIVNIIDDLIKKNHLQNSTIYDLLIHFNIIEVSRHPSKKPWYTYEIIQSEKDEEEEEIAFDGKKVLKSLTANMKKSNYCHKVEMIYHEDLYFVQLIDKPKSHQKLVPLKSIVIAIRSDRRYFFSRTMDINKLLIQVIANALDCEKIKRVRLHGKFIKMLSEQLNRKDHPNSVPDMDELEEHSKPVIKESGIDFTQHAHRKKHIEQTMNTRNLKLESLKFECNGVDALLPPELLSSKIDLSGIKLDIGWTFKSENVFEMIPKMSQNCQLDHPAPEYLIESMKMGKNEIKYKYHTVQD